LKKDSSKILRERVAREAALLLYSFQEKEYKQAKQRAAKNLKTRILPSNREVAEKLDRIAEEVEGASKKRLLLRMRTESQELMTALKDHNPRLMGSVWRGTALKNSDIDILAYSQNPNQILNQLQKQNYKVKHSEWCSVTKEGKKESSFHIHVLLISGDEAEVVVRSLEYLGQLERCEIYGDINKGMKLHELQKVLKEDPFQKFVPL
jgi:predicted nucleotidyltransferase